MTAAGPLAARPESGRCSSCWPPDRVATGHSGLPSVSIGVVYDQELVRAAGFGEADTTRHVPATPDTLYRIASIAKLFAATSVLRSPPTRARCSSTIP